MFTVAKLIKLLETFPGDLPVGVIGWYGEFYPMDKLDFRESHVQDESYNGTVLAIDHPGKGEPPE